MQRIIKSLVLFTLLCLIASCSNDFLKENQNNVIIPLGVSDIYISPDWSTTSRHFKLPSLKNADYEIVSKPTWLNVGSLSGHLSDSIADIQCSATKNSTFSTVGIYIDFMTVKADGKNYKVPVTYITEGNPKVLVQNSLTLSYSVYNYASLQIQNTGLGILMWNVTSMPEWLAVDTSRLETNGQFIAQNNSYNIPLKFKIDKNITGSLTGKIVLSTNDKDHPSVSVNVSIDLGTPQLSINTNTINFSSSETSKTLSLSNYGNGMLIWSFENIPEWLTITPSSGIYNPYTYYNNIIFSCDRSKLSPGQNTATVKLKTNDNNYSSYDITVTAIAPGNNANIRPIEGNIIDALFNKNTNTLYFVTNSPNKLIAYDVTSKAILHEIALSKAPTCFAITENWTKAAVGHNGYISAIDLSNYTVSATYSLDYSVYDIAWAENNWFCFTQNGGSFSSLHWLNTADGTKYDDTDKYSLDGSTMIKKVPNQPYLIATRGGTSPSGFFAYSIATKSKKSYSHMDLSNFWMSEDGQYIFARDLNIYRTSSSTGSSDTFDADINSIGKIKFNSTNNYGINFIYHSNHYLWIIQNDSYSSDSPVSIYKFEDNDYTQVKKYYYDLVYQPDTQTSSFSVKANYVFANNEGTEISVLSKGTSNNTWIIQFISEK